MKKIITVTLLLASIVSVITAQTTIPIPNKKLETINSSEINQYNLNNQSKIKLSEIVYFEIFMPVEVDPSNTAVIIKRHAGKFYSNMPFTVKMDTINKRYRVYKSGKLVYLLYTTKFINYISNSKSI